MGLFLLLLLLVFCVMLVRNFFTVFVCLFVGQQEEEKKNIDLMTNFFLSSSSSELPREWEEVSIAQFHKCGLWSSPKEKNLFFSSSFVLVCVCVWILLLPPLGGSSTASLLSWKERKRKECKLGRQREREKKNFFFFWKESERCKCDRGEWLTMNDHPGRRGGRKEGPNEPVSGTDGERPDQTRPPALVGTNVTTCLILYNNFTSFLPSRLQDVD